MMLRARIFLSILIMLSLPLQSALAAIMPLCAQARNISVSGAPENQIDHEAPSAACPLHDNSNHKQPDRQPGGDNAEGEADLTLSCDGVVCHISGNGLPSAASALNLPGGFSYAILPISRFSSLVLQQPQRPPLA
ncbi:hypothetical protein [Nitrosospira multiformis]|uniref:hypothetical protein n=1 Tax=Nitrosospira multiformis TaxID=1231 RepID=UPI0009435CD8|nr:hypothetical protein [Nitrosospira multiformis]